MKHDFETEIKLLEGKIKWPVVYFPYPAQELFGANGRVNVRVSVDGHSFDAVLLPSRNGHYFVFNAAMKKRVGKELGDTVQVSIERSEEKREVVLSQEVSSALEQANVLDKFQQMPYYIRREEIVKITSAKHEETKARRLQALLEKLAGQP